MNTTTSRGLNEDSVNGMCSGAWIGRLLEAATH